MRPEVRCPQSARARGPRVRLHGEQGLAPLQPRDGLTFQARSCAGNHGTEMPLVIKELAHKVSDICSVDLFARCTHFTERRCHHALDVAFGIRIVYVRGRTYIEIAPGDECAGLIITRDGTTGVKKSPVGETIPCAAELEALVNDLYFIQDPSKPIRAISAYSLSDLTLIAKKLDVALTDDGGKRKLKKRLYEDITANL